MKLRHGALVLSALVCSGLVLAAYAQKSGSSLSVGKRRETKHGFDGAQAIRARANWFFQQRAYPLGHIPAFARQRAWNAFRQSQEQQRQYFLQKYGPDYRRQMAALAQATSAPAPAAPWTAIGPQPTNEFYSQPVVSGRVAALLVDPCDSTGNTVFLGGAQGGLWKTTDGGQHWTVLTDQAASLAVGSLAAPPNSCLSSPATTATIYVGTGEENFSFDSYYGAGVLKCTTTDGLNYSCAPDQTLGQYNAYPSTSKPLDQNYGGAFIGGLAVDPQNPSIMLAAVQGYQSTLPSGIWCSADAGSTWSHIVPGPGVLGDVGTAVAFDQAGYGYGAIGNIDGGGGINGIYVSSAPLTNCSPGPFSELSNLDGLAGGASAMGRISFSVYSTSTTSASSDEIFALVANASDDSGTLNDVFKSTDGGAVWTALSDPLLANGGFCQDQCFYDIPITIDPHNSSVIYAGGSGPDVGGETIIASTNGGTSWTDVSLNNPNICSSSSPTACDLGVHVDAHAIAFEANGSKVYVGTDGGVWSSGSGVNPESFSTYAWSNLNLTLGLTQIYSGMSTNPSGWQYRSYLGAQDNGTQVLAPDLTNPSVAALAWNDTLSCGDGGVTLVDPLIPSTVYGECSYIPAVLLGIEKSMFNGNVDDSNDSSGGGSSFVEASAGINLGDNGNFIPAFAIDPEQTPGSNPADAETLYFGTCRVWQTTNGGASWNPISPDVTGGPPTSPICNSGSGQLSDVLTSIAVAPTDSNIVVTGSNNGHISVTMNAGQGANSTWTDVTSATLPGRVVTQVAVDPSNPDALYAAYSGFSSCTGCDGKGHVFIGTLTPTATPSVVWTDISSGVCVSPDVNLPDIPVNAIVVDPSQPGTLYVGTDVGVYVGTLQGTPPAVTGACWQPLGASGTLPNSAVLSLTLNEASRTLIAGTHGRSAWALQLSGVPTFALTSISPASESTGYGAFAMTLEGNGFTASSTGNWTPQGGSATSLTQTTPPAGCALPTCMAVTVPSTLTNSSGIVQVSVTDPSQPTTDTDCNGKASSTDCLKFTVTSLVPTVTSISPTSGTSGSAATLALQGTNFDSSTTVGLATEVSAAPCSPLSQNSGGTSTSIAANISGACLQYGGIYFVTANNPAPGGGTSNPGLVAAAAPYGSSSCPSGSPPGCLLTVTGAAPSNESFANATSVTTSSFATTEDTSGATSSPNGPSLATYFPNCTVVGSGSSGNDDGDYKSVWYKYTPATSGTAEVDTIGSNYDTILTVWSGTSQNNLTPVACNDDIVSGIDLVSQITGLSLTANTTYYFMVSDWGVPVYDGTGSNITQVLPSGGKLVFNLAVTTTPPPTFTASASALTPSTISAGSTASFTITLDGSSSSPNGSVSLQPCTIAPANTTISCSYNPGSIMVGPSSSNGSTVTISTEARGALAPAGPFQRPPIGWIFAVLFAAVLLAFAMRQRAMAGQPAGLRSRIAAALGFALLAATLVFSGACGGGSSSPGPTGTAAGTYTITVPLSPAASNANPSVQLTVQ